MKRMIKNQVNIFPIKIGIRRGKENRRYFETTINRGEKEK